MKLSSCVCVISAVCLAAACAPRPVNMRPTIEYVEEIMNGTRERERSVLESSARPSPSSDISIIGNSAFCFAYADFLADYDERDNVSGAHSPDGLPDFAGESFVCIAEDSPSAARIRVSDTLGLRRDAVMSMLCALDTVVHITPYDLEGSGRKPSSKLVVLADPCLAEFGLFDMDTLKRATGNSVPLVSTFDLMLAELFEARPGSSLNVAVICDSELVPEEVYANRFRRAASAAGVPASECMVFPSEGRDSLLHRMVVDYCRSGGTDLLDAVLVDDPAVVPDSIKTEFADMVSLMNASSMTYGRRLAPDFRLIHGFDVLAEYCYDEFRRQNMFTHNIAMPEIELYRPAPAPGSENGEIILIPDLYVQN